MQGRQKLIDEYSEEYCLLLEATYNKGMLSEGAEKAIDNMFCNIDIAGKTLLDIGFGLGGVAFYLAKHYRAKVFGIEINPWLVEIAMQRRPVEFKDQLHFSVYDDLSKLPFQNEQFDVVYSKGVLTHVRPKEPLFSEVYRILQPGGYFVIDDWLSPNQDKWGPKIGALMELENLTLFAETEENYQTLLGSAGFKSINMRSENSNYESYNRAIVNNLLQEDKSEEFIKKFDSVSHAEFIQGYTLIADAIAENELLIRNFVCEK